MRYEREKPIKDITTVGSYFIRFVVSHDDFMTWTRFRLTRITGDLGGESTGQRYSPLIIGQNWIDLVFSLFGGLKTNPIAGDLRCCDAHVPSLY